MPLTLAGFRPWANWPQVLNMDSSDVRWLQLLNEATLRLLNMGMWMGTTQRYAICATNGCITWPRQFETIIGMDVCGVPMPLRSQWHEFLENGPGLARARCCNPFSGFDRGSGYVMFNDIGTPSIIRLTTQFAGDAGKTVTIRGLDENYQPVLTNNGDTVGEVMTLTGTFVDSATVWGKQVFREVIKQVTKGYVRAYSYDATLPPPPAEPGPNDTPLTPLAVWEPTETLPDYRRTYIPSLNARSGGCCQSVVTDQSTTCQQTAITVIAKIKFIPIAAELDFLPISNRSALTMAMVSVMREQRGDTAGAREAMYGTLDQVRRRYVGGAVPLLEDELDTWQGAGTAMTIRTESGMIAGAQTLNLI